MNGVSSDGKGFLNTPSVWGTTSGVVCVFPVLWCWAGWMVAVGGALPGGPWAVRFAALCWRGESVLTA